MPDALRAKLIEALKPFADASQNMKYCGTEMPDDTPLSSGCIARGTSHLKVGDLKRAARVLRELESQACSLCGGRRTVAVKHGSIFETDSLDEISLAYHDEPCPVCG